MADSVAAFAVGLITHNQGYSSAHVAEVDGAIQAFWASFLLLHLGGPDTITTFSLEDSSLWQRHLLNLIFQVSAAIYVYVRIFPSDKSLVIPTILVFLAGFIKIAERTLALYLSSFPKLRESMLSDSELKMAADLPRLLIEVFVHQDGYGRSNEEEEELAESIVVNHAYSFFQIFKVFIVDLIYTKEQRKMSTDYFNKVSVVDALRVISVELNFIYEELHTKALTIRHKWIYIFRIIAFTSIVVALGLFNHLKKYQLYELDVKITYILLFGGIIIDGIVLFIVVFSDWTAAKIKYNTTGSFKLYSFLCKLVSATDYLRKCQYTTCDLESNNKVTYKVLDTPLIFRRWSESISARNLFSEALMKSPRKIRKCNQHQGIVVFKSICGSPLQMVDKIISCFLQAGETIGRCCGKESLIGNVKYMSKNPFMKKLWIFIFEWVKDNSKPMIDSGELEFVVKSILSFSSGTLRDHGKNSFDLTKANMHNMIITGHIATEIWYNKEKQPVSSTSPPDPTQVDKREFSKILSDYMLYLLLNKPNWMSAVAMVGIAQMVSAKTLHEIRHIIGETKDLDRICEKLYNREVEDGMAPQARSQEIPEEMPTDPLKSPLNKGLLLARQLEHVERKWEQMSNFWVNALLTTAINIKGETHVQVLSKGGELLTFVWLLMAHLGFFYKPEWGMYRSYWEEMSARRSE